jgi:hypothetical protein
MRTDLSIETHEDDSVTLRVGSITANIKGDGWRDANDAAHALGAIIVGRYEVAALRLRLSSMRSIVEDVERSLRTTELHMGELAEYAAAPCNGEAMSGECGCLYRSECKVHGSGQERDVVVCDECLQLPKARAEIARLTAERDAMARLLLKLEWAGRQDYVGDGGYECCPSCKGVSPDQTTMSDAVDDVARGRTVVGHRVDCELAKALRR